MVDAVLWFLTIQLLGVAALPWVFQVFRFLPDRGVTLAKPAAVLVISYLVWVFGLAQLLPNTALTIWIITLCVIIASMWLAGRRWEELREFLRLRWPLLLAGELAFLLMFVAWALVVSGSPGITHTEKPMDFMLLNSAYQTRYFPAEDAWLAGHSISYYYFGHIAVATLSKMSGVVTAVGYNLGVATVPALAGIVAVGLLYNLVRLAGGSVRWALGLGAATPAVILLAGNLAGALEFVRIRGWGGPGFWDWVGIEGLVAQAAQGGVFPGEFWWWFRSTRIINTASSDGATLDYTITEFPAFSFLLGDLHAHVLAIPFLLLATAAALNVYCSSDRLELAWLRRNPAQVISVALAGGALAFINFWDFATFMALFAAALTLKGCRDYPNSLLHAVSGAVSVFLPLFLLAIILFGPVYFSFSGQTDGVLPLREVSTNPFHLFIVLGLFILPCLALLARRLAGIRLSDASNTPLAVVALVIAATPFGIWMATAFLFTIVADGANAALDDLGRRLTLALPGAIVVGLAAYLGGRLGAAKQSGAPLCLRRKERDCHIVRFVAHGPGILPGDGCRPVPHSGRLQRAMAADEHRFQGLLPGMATVGHFRHLRRIRLVVKQGAGRKYCTLDIHDGIGREMGRRSGPGPFAGWLLLLHSRSDPRKRRRIRRSPRRPHPRWSRLPGSGGPGGVCGHRLAPRRGASQDGWSRPSATITAGSATYPPVLDCPPCWDGWGMSSSGGDPRNHSPVGPRTCQPSIHPRTRGKCGSCCKNTMCATYTWERESGRNMACPRGTISRIFCKPSFSGMT